MSVIMDNQGLKDGWVASFHYRIKDMEGNILDTSDEGPPANTIMGTASTLEGIEEALYDRKAGDKFEITLSPDKAFGEPSGRPSQCITKEQFGFDGEILVGMQCMAHMEDGTPIAIWVEKVEGDDVWLTDNHPLAGVSLKVELEITEAREATVEELEGGHVCGGCCDT